MGLGDDPSFSDTLKAARSFSFKQKKRLSKQLAVSFLQDNLPDEASIHIEAVVNGLVLGCYSIGRFKTEQLAAHPLDLSGAELTLYVPATMSEAAEAAAQQGKAIAETQMQMFDLVNAPANKKLPADLAAWALQSGKKHGYQVEVFDKKKITDKNLHALLAVNRGSESPAVFIVMEYKPAGIPTEKLKKVGLVGKGVTFDTGGLSIKPSANMHFMKSDMGGAAAVLGTMESAAKLKLPLHLIGIIPATDNSVGSNAIKPSDVIDSYSGKTIEIIDTDAEGRLILADGLAYMIDHFAPEILIDLATLTGSAVRTFGYHAAGLFSNNDDLAAQISTAGRSTGELVWRLPIWDVYRDDIKSDVADVRNYSGKPIAGAIGAAKFLEAFIGDHPRWAHMDIAGVAFNDSEFSGQKSATAFGVRLLLEFFKALNK